VILALRPEDLSSAVDVDFEEEKEHWNTYKLSDGTTLKIKLVLRGVKRLKKFNPDGSPVYIINSTNVVRTLNVPEKLKGKPFMSKKPPTSQYA
jgi:hypothetical protein